MSTSTDFLITKTSHNNINHFMRAGMTQPLSTTKRGIKLLMIDDSPFMQEILELHLSDLIFSQSIQVLKAFNGNMGLRMMLSERPQIVLLDVNMPFKDGPTMLAELHESAAWSQGYQPELIALTSQTDPKLISRLFELGVNYYYTKPFNPNAMVTWLHYMIKTLPRNNQFN